MNTLSRRTLLRGAAAADPVLRPPWTGSDFTDLCTRCDACIRACPDGLLSRGDGGFPEIGFTADGCNFCERCAQACEASVFDLARQPFDWRLVIQSSCLALSNIDCRSCQDACEPNAIRFVPTLGRVPQPVVSLDACNGCGACLSVCPVNAATLESPHGQ
jgi:ferredoxin-type protein NapF